MVKSIKNAKTNTGIEDSERKKTAKALNSVLADTYTLYLKTHYFHWNVTGPLFGTLHTLFEAQYTELAAAVDEIAERIRALGYFAPGSYQEFNQLTSIDSSNDLSSSVLKAEQMIQDLVKCHETVVQTAKKAFEIAEETKDEGTADLLIQREQVHEKAAWMLRSFLD